jgi:hypothetical protein
MLDYEGVNIELFPEKSNPSERFVVASLATLTSAVAKDANFVGDELQIKQYFEHFLLSLSRLNYFLTSRAIEPNELCADLGYYVRLMNGDARVREMKLKNSNIDMAPFANAVRSYLDRWDYFYVNQFLERIQKACG